MLTAVDEVAGQRRWQQPPGLDVPGGDVTGGQGQGDGVADDADHDDARPAAAPLQLGAHDVGQRLGSGVPARLPHRLGHGGPLREVRLDHLRPCGLVLEVGLDPCDELVGVVRLDEIVARPGAEAADSVGDVLVGGHEQDRERPGGGLGADRAEHVETAQPGHVVVEQHGRERAVGEKVQRLAPGDGFDRLDTGRGESAGGQVPRDAVVVDDEHGPLSGSLPVLCPDDRGLLGRVAVCPLAESSAPRASNLSAFARIAPGARGLGVSGCRGRLRPGRPRTTRAPRSGGRRSGSRSPGRVPGRGWRNCEPAPR